MTQEKIQRINYLSKKAKTEGLSDSEKNEQQLLRNEYIKDLKSNLKNTLDNLVIVDEHGNKKTINKKLKP